VSGPGCRCAQRPRSSRRRPEREGADRHLPRADRGGDQGEDSGAGRPGAAGVAGRLAAVRGARGGACAGVDSGGGAAGGGGGGAPGGVHRRLTAVRGRRRGRARTRVGPRHPAAARAFEPARRSVSQGESVYRSMSGRKPSRSQNDAGASRSRMCQINETPRSRSHAMTRRASSAPAPSGRRPSIMSASISPCFPVRGRELTRAVAIPRSSPSTSTPKAAKSSRPDSARSVSILDTVSGASVPSARSFHVRAPLGASCGDSGRTRYEAAIGG
jgi:hypothetical protein